ncbi:VG15 protein [Nocardia sp. NPDC001965]
MTPGEYAALQAAIVAAIIRTVVELARLMLTPALTPTDWIRFLRLVYPQVEIARAESAELARRFYDSQREQNHPELPRNDQLLEGSDFGVFVQTMEPARRRMSQADAIPTVVGELARIVAKDVENAGRRQIIRGVENDSATGIVRGWARVATGRETCGWCLMLISRGPVYMAAETAGLDLTDRTAAQMIAAGEDVSEYMDEWHDGCDCKVVPVYKATGYPSEAAEKRAMELWKDAAREAARLIRSGKARSDNHNTEAINVLRRRIYHGEINPMEYAFAA